MAIDAFLVGARGTTSGSSVSTTGGTVTTGETLAAGICYDPGVTISTITDTAGNTYTLVDNQTGGFGKLALYRCENATGHASNVLTVTFSGNAFATAILGRISDAAAASYDGASLASGTDSTTPFEITTGTFAQADTCVISLVECNRSGGTGAYASSNFTILDSEPDANNFWTLAMGKLVVAATTAVTPSWTKVGDTASGLTRGIIAVGFKQTAGGGATGGGPALNGGRVIGRGRILGGSALAA